MSWSAREKGILGAYRRYSGMGDAEYRELLYVATGFRSSTAVGLRQGHFDVVMARIETRAHLAEVNGCAVGKRPAIIGDWHYWRKRCSGPGAITTRQRREIARLWMTACHWLDEEDRTAGYLLGVATTAAGRDVSALDDLTDTEAGALVEALKSLARRLARQAARSERERIERAYGKRLADSQQAGCRETA